jgi:hypothetical protein
MSSNQVKKIVDAIQNGYRTTMAGEVIYLSAEMIEQYKRKLLRPHNRILYLSKSAMPYGDDDPLAPIKYKTYPPAIKSVDLKTGGTIYLPKKS